MALRKTEEKNIRSLIRTSNGKSYAITLPVEVVRKWKWQNHQKLKLEIDDRNKRIIIRDWKK